MSTDLSGPANLTQWVMRNVKDPNVCLMAADSSADGKRGNEPTAYLTGNCSTIQAPYAVQFNKTANNTFFVQSRAQGRMMAIGDSSFEPRGDGRIFASTGDNRIGSPVIAVVDPDDATLWNVSRSAFNYAALTITVPSTVANETLAVTVGIDTGFGNVTVQKLTGNDSAQEFILQDASDVFNYFGVNV